MADETQKPKLATDLPQPAALTDADLERLDKEATECRAAVETDTASPEKLTAEDEAFNRIAGRLSSCAAGHVNEYIEAHVGDSVPPDTLAIRAALYGITLAVAHELVRARCPGCQDATAQCPKHDMPPPSAGGPGGP